MQPPNPAPEKKTKWERTPVQNLLRNRDSGRYYGRWTVSVNKKPRQIWRKLETAVFTVAKRRLIEEAAKIQTTRGNGLEIASTTTVGDLMASYEGSLGQTTLKSSSVAARLVGLKAVRKSWPELATMKPNRVSVEAVRTWATNLRVIGTNYVPPGSHTTIRGNSPTSVNRAIDTLRRVLDMAVEAGLIHINPVTVRPADPSRKLRLKVKKERWAPPSVADVQRLFLAMENNGAVGGWGQEAADFCRFMQFSGCRVGEAAAMTWAMVDWNKKLIRVPGEKTENSEDRPVPLFGDLDALLKRIIERRKAAARFAPDGKSSLEPADRVFRISECQRTIDAACAKIGISRLTHHDFRHLFATRCIESGVDIPTVSRWLGHSDGGALAMRVYGHLRDEHSQAQAAKVSFH